MLFLDKGIGANNTSKQKVDHCDKTMLQIFFHIYYSKYLCSIGIPCQNSAKKYPVVLEKKLLLLFCYF